ncbi:MAG: hypothetical protein IPG02_18525 [Ignavibacteria bacterium]|nr:hypothetical protein [Ignavibacteria bacterium]
MTWKTERKRIEENLSEGAPKNTPQGILTQNPKKIEPATQLDGNVRAPPELTNNMDKLRRIMRKLIRFTPPDPLGRSKTSGS